MAFHVRLLLYPEHHDYLELLRSTLTPKDYGDEDDEELGQSVLSACDQLGSLPEANGHDEDVDRL